MHFRTITAPDMETAMAKLRSSMGPDALILNTQRSANGQITLRAAIEHAPDPHAELTASVQHGQQAWGAGHAMQYDSGHAQIADALAFHRVPEAAAAPLMQTLGLADGDAVLALGAALDTRYRFAPLPYVPERPILLIGPAGAGKTLTAAKLAARALLNGGGAMLISTDTVRAGGTAQLAAYAEIMKRQLFTAADGEALANRLQSRPKNTACIIDTQGVSPFNPAEFHALQTLVMAAGVDPVLVLPAGGDAAEACEIVSLFAGLGARGLIVTRLDATRRLGSILSALETGAMTLHHVSITPYVADGLAPVTPVALARIFLQDPYGHDSYNELEQASS